MVESDWNIDQRKAEECGSRVQSAGIRFSMTIALHWGHRERAEYQRHSGG